MASGRQELAEAQVQAAALPGESWEEARDRLFWEQLGQNEPSRSCVTMRPGYLQSPPGMNASCAQLDALRAFQQLSRRQQFDYWLAIQGRSRPADILECPSLASLVAIGMEWNDCTGRVPHEDERGRLYYLVGVDYDTWLTCCRYTGWGWERKSDRSLISGVSHWRIAREEEQFSREATADEVRTIHALRRLSEHG